MKWININAWLTPPPSQTDFSNASVENVSILVIKLLPIILRHRHPSQGSVRPGERPLQVLRGPRHCHLLRLRELHAGRVRQESPGELETQGRCHLLGHIAGIQSTDAEGSSHPQIFIIIIIYYCKQLSCLLLYYAAVVNDFALFDLWWIIIEMRLWVWCSLPHRNV